MNKMSRTKEEREDMAGAIRYIKFSGYHEKLDECKEVKKQFQDTKEY